MKRGQRERGIFLACALATPLLGLLATPLTHKALPSLGFSYEFHAPVYAASHSCVMALSFVLIYMTACWLTRDSSRAAGKKWHIASLRVYPLKSAAGIELKAARFLDRGLFYDRDFAVMRPDLHREKESEKASETKVEILTARECPRLLRIQPELPDYETGKWTLRFYDTDGVTEMAKITLDIRTGSAATDKMLLWDNICGGIDQGDAAAEWISEMADMPGLRLMKFHEREGRTSSKFSPPRFMDPPRFADGMPVLVASMGTIQGIAASTGISADEVARRYRMNIVLDSCSSDSQAAEGAFVEDTWERVRVSDQLELKAMKPCSRCNLPLHNPVTSKHDGAFLSKALKLKHRRSCADLMHVKGLDPDSGGIVGFGRRIALSAACVAVETGGRLIGRTSSGAQKKLLLKECQAAAPALDFPYTRRDKGGFEEEIASTPMRGKLLMLLHDVLPKTQLSSFTTYYKNSYGADKLVNGGVLYVGNNMGRVVLKTKKDGAPKGNNGDFEWLHVSKTVVPEKHARAAD